MTTQFTIFSQPVTEKINKYFEENPHTGKCDPNIPHNIFNSDELKEILSHCQVDDYAEGMFSLYFREYNENYKIKAQCGLDWISEDKCAELGFEFEKPFCVDDTESWEYTWHGN